MRLPFDDRRASTAVVPVLFPVAPLIASATSCNDVAPVRFTCNAVPSRATIRKSSNFVVSSCSSAAVVGTPMPRLKSAKRRRPGVRANAKLRGGGSAILANREIGAAQSRLHVDAVARRVDFCRQAQPSAGDQVQQILDGHRRARIERHGLAAVG